MKVKVLHNQSLFDIAIQHTGDVMNAFEIAKENSLSITSYVVPGYELTVPNGVAFNREIHNYYTSKGVKPATDVFVMADTPETQGGISYWAINKDFEVQ